MISIGAAYRWYNSGQNAALDNLGTFDLGLTFRPTNWLSVAAEANAFNAPYLSGTPLPRIYTVGVGLRPFSKVLTLAVDYSVDDQAGWRGSKLSYLLNIHLPRGLDLAAQLAHEVEEPVGGRHVALEVGLHGEFGYGGLWLAEATQLTNSSGGFGGVIAADLHIARAESLVVIGGKAVVLDIGKELAKPSTLLTLLGFTPAPRRVHGAAAARLGRARGGRVARHAHPRGSRPRRSVPGPGRGPPARAYALRHRGKHVLAWIESGGDTEYYLATAAEKIYVAPESLESTASRPRICSCEDCSTSWGSAAPSS